MRARYQFLVAAFLLALFTVPTEVLFTLPTEVSGQQDGCSFCFEDCPNEDEVRARTHEVGGFAIGHPPFACSESEGCDSEPICEPSEEDAEEQTNLVALLEANDLQGISSFGRRFAPKLETIPERNLVLFSSGRCGNPVIGVIEATEEQLRALKARPEL